MENSISVLQQHNPWWIRKEMILDDVNILDYQQKKYQYVPPIVGDYPVNTDAILTLRGPRQIGKSTSLKLLIRKLLLEDKIPEKTVFYFSLDRIEDFNQLYDLLSCYLNDIRTKTNDRLHIFLDEISFVREWQRCIKALADEGRLKNATLLLTGSNTIDIMKGSERMPGRRGSLDKLDYDQLPLTFYEFIKMIDPAIECNNIEHLIFSQNLLNSRFKEYLITGGFPLTMNLFYSQEYISSFAYQIYVNWIEGDIGRVGKSERNLYQIMSRVLTHLSTGISWHSMSKEAGIVSHKTVQEYIELLERMYVLYTIPFIDLSSKLPKYRKNKKIAFTDPLIFHCFSGMDKGVSDNLYHASLKFLDDPNQLGKLVENIVGRHIALKYKNIFYWQGKKEIDFVVKEQNKLKFFEVKYQERVSTNEFEWFIKQHSSKENLTVITKHNIVLNQKIQLIPAPIFLMILENNLLNGLKQLN
jgi:hypothetical protein